MKNNTYLSAFAGAMAIAFVLFGAACGKKDNNNSVAVNQCGVGYVQSAQYGCLTQGNCGVGAGMVNGYCQPINNNNVYGNTCTGGMVNTTYGCVPQGPCSVNQGFYNGQCVIATTPNSQYGNQYGYGQQQYYGNQYGYGQGYYGNPYGYNQGYNPGYPYYGSGGGGAYFRFGFGY